MPAVVDDVVLNILTKDASLAIFSFVFVFFWIRVNTLSWFLAFVGFFEIFFSIPIAWFIFTVIFRIKYFAYLNSLALFVVAAIGADDICEGSNFFGFWTVSTPSSHSDSVVYSSFLR